MASTSQPAKGREGVLSTLDGFILTLNVAKDACGILPAQGAFSAASALLTTIRDTIANQQDCIELAQVCADVCDVLDRGLEGKQLDELSRSVVKAIERFTKTMATIQGKIIKHSERKGASRFFRSKVDKDQITAWKQDILRILLIFNTELLINAVVVSDAQQARGDASHQQQSAQASIPPGEIPPPPISCFGRGELIEKVVGLAEDLKPIALIGAGGIGKTSIALSVLHHNRIEEQFGDNRRFIRCDKFPASRAHFLARLSSVIGAGVENPKDLASLRPFLSSNEIFIVLDNVESILDPHGPDAQEIYAIVNELCRFKTICVCITSRITTVPPHCTRPKILTLSMDAARDIFYTIYGEGDGRSGTIDDLLLRLDFHALSITLLATTASHNVWDYDRLAKEWGTSWGRILRTDYNESLAATIELSLDSPTFRKLGSIARELLGVVAFFPQGVCEKNIDWLVPTLPDGKNMFDKFCSLSLTYRNNDFVTMLAPIRDYLCPQDPKSSPLLCATRDNYFTRLSVDIHPGRPVFDEAQWITLEDVNVEHLLDVFASIDADSDDVWDACWHFMDHLYWHKPRETVLARKVEGLSDEHHSKLRYLSELSILFSRIGNDTERKRILIHVVELERRRGNEIGIARALTRLSDANRRLKLREEGIQQAKEALEIFERIGNTFDRAGCSATLALLFFADKQLDAAEEAALGAINLISGKGQENLTCELHRLLGDIYRRKGEKEKAMRQYETALGIASAFNWHHQLFWIHWSLALLFSDEDNFDEANVHIEKAKSHAINNQYLLGRAMETQARIWRREGKLKDATSEVLGALEIFNKLGAAEGVKDCRVLLEELNKKTRSVGFARAHPSTWWKVLLGASRNQPRT